MATGMIKPAKGAGDSVTIDVEFVSPEQAQRWLSHNTRNRPLRTSRVEAFARDMAAGRWDFNGETYKFDINGTVLDGQHRMAAQVRSGVTLRVPVVRGLPPEVQDTVDIGSARSLGDTLTLRDHPDAKALAAIARRVVRYQRGTTSSGGAGLVTNPEVLTYVEAHPELRRAVEVAQLARVALPAAPSAIGAAYHLCSRVFQPNAELFFVDQLIKSLGLSEYDPARVLADRIRRESQVKGRQMHPDDVFRFSLLAWNHFRAGNKISKLQAPPNGWTAQNTPVPR